MSLLISNSMRVLAFLIWSLVAWIISLHSSQATCCCFHCLQVSFLCLSLARSILFIYAGLLVFLSDFLFVEAHCFWTWKRWFLNINQFPWAPLHFRAMSHSPLASRWIPKEAKVWSPKVPCNELAIHQGCSMDPELGHFMMTAVKAFIIISACKAFVLISKEMQTTLISEYIYPNNRE